MKIKLILLVILISSITFPQDVLDKVVAVVDNEIILQSELDFQAALFASQRGIDPNSQGLREQILKPMIDEKPDNTIQLVRFGFVRIDHIEEGFARFYYSHA